MLYRFLLASLLIIGCQTKPTAEDVALAKANNKTFYSSDLTQQFPANFRPEDSLDIAQSYIDQWIRKQILLDEAEQQISRDINIEKLVKDYRSSLILANFEKLLVDKSLDTLVTDEQINLNYEKNKDQFFLREPLIKCVFAKFPEDSPNLDKFNEQWEDKNWLAIRSYAKEFAIDTLFEADMWIPQKYIEQMVPSKLTKKVKWKEKGSVQQNINDLEFFLSVIDFKDKNEEAPISYVQDKIVKLIIHERKKSILKDYENALLKQKINSKEVIIY